MVKKIDAGAIIFGILAFAILKTGIPFGNPLSNEELWTWAWKMVFGGTILTTGYLIGRKLFEKWF